MAYGNLFGAPGVDNVPWWVYGDPLSKPQQQVKSIPQQTDTWPSGPSSLDPWRTGGWPWGQTTPSISVPAAPYLPLVSKGMTPYQQMYGALPVQQPNLYSGPTGINQLPWGTVGPGLPASTGGVFGPSTAPGNQALADIFARAAAQGVAQGIGPLIGTTTGDVTHPTAGAGAGGAGAPGAPKAPQYKPMPAGLIAQAAEQGFNVPENWWQEFQAKHEGETPLEYYGAQGYGDQSLGAALHDLDWSQGVMAQTGSAPTDAEWVQHWYHKQGMMTHPEYEAYKKKLDKDRKKAKEEAMPQRPPTWQPPLVWWNT